MFNFLKKLYIGDIIVNSINVLKYGLSFSHFGFGLEYFGFRFKCVGCGSDFELQNFWVQKKKYVNLTYTYLFAVLKINNYLFYVQSYFIIYSYILSIVIY